MVSYLPGRGKEKRPRVAENVVIARYEEAGVLVPMRLTSD
jgi:hypothetical protein